MKNYILIGIIGVLIIGGYLVYQWSFRPTTPSTQPESSTPTTQINDRCKLEPETGSCKARFIRYYFDQEEKTCKEFIWGGCEGKIPFETLKECQETCES